MELAACKPMACLRRRPVRRVVERLDAARCDSPPPSATRHTIHSAGGRKPPSLPPRARPGSAMGVPEARTRRSSSATVHAPPSPPVALHHPSQSGHDSSKWHSPRRARPVLDGAPEPLRDPHGELGCTAASRAGAGAHPEWRCDAVQVEVVDRVERRAMEAEQQAPSGGLGRLGDRRCHASGRLLAGLGGACGLLHSVAHVGVHLAGRHALYVMRHHRRARVPHFAQKLCMGKATGR